jgi:hypothetical protein
MLETCNPDSNDYAFTLAMSLLAATDLDIFPKDENGYGSLKSVIARMDINMDMEEKGLAAAIKAKHFPHPDEVAKCIKEIVGNETKDWKVKQILGRHTNALVMTCGDEAAVCFPPIPPIAGGVWAKAGNMGAADFTAGTGKECKVHSGFLSILNEVNEPVREELERVQGDISFKGFSLGGALSVLCALGLPAEQQARVKCITAIAPPHLGNTESAEAVEEAFGGKVFIAEQGHDPVTYMPKRFVPIPGHRITIEGVEHSRLGEKVGAFNIVNHYPTVYFKGLDDWRKGMGEGAVR